MIDSLFPRFAFINVENNSYAVSYNQFEAESASFGVCCEAVSHCYPTSVDNLDIIASPVVLKAPTESD